MNKKIIIGVLMFCLLAFAAVMAFSQNVPSGNVRWEYTTITFDIDRANQLGQQGWELVTSSAQTNGVSQSSYFLVFKRRLP